MESDKYFETLGVLEFELVNGTFQNFSQEFVDTSMSNFYAMSGTTPDSFPTPRGQALKQTITKYYNLLQLNHTYGCAPETFSPTLDISNPLSLYNLFLNKIIPSIVSYCIFNMVSCLKNSSKTRSSLCVILKHFVPTCGKEE